MSDRLTAALAELVDALREEVRKDTGATSPTPDRLLAVDEAARALGIGRTLAYGLFARGELRSIKVGRRRLVPTSAISEYANKA
jgi:excisionase family DNA binding protein